MIGNDRFVQVFGSVVAGDDELLIQLVSNAVREGFAIVLLKPGEKTPICTLNTTQRKAADTAAQDAARTIGDIRWQTRRHECGINHALTVEWAGDDSTKVRAKVGALIRRVVKDNGGRNPNIGVELGRSRMLVVDVDTTDEYQGFLSDWPDDGRDTHIPGMTVKSPGVQDVNGEWKHKNGGHYWFSIPDGVDLPAYNGVYRAESGWVAMWADHQVLVPPSVRAEGAYEIVGQLNPAPAWLTERIIAATVARMERVANRSTLPDGTADIDVWSAGITWAEMLTGDDWTDTGLPDRCSCPIFTAPGPHGSPKSATAHDVGCDRYDASPGHAPLHVWTDNPPEWLADAIRRTGSKTFTKIQYLAWRDHDGAVLGALRDLGLAGSAIDSEFPGFGAVDELTTFNPVDVAVELAAERAAPAQPGGNADQDAGKIFDDPGVTDTEVASPAPEQTRAELIRSLMIGSADLDSLPEPESLIDGFLDVDTIARVTGKSGDGKSFLMLDMASCVATGMPWHGAQVKQGLVVYMVAEGVRGWKRRMRAWEAQWNDGTPIPNSGMLIMPVPIQAAGSDWHPFVQALTTLQPVLVILDTQARITVGVDENDATAMGMLVERLEQIRRATGACVVAVHHLGHSGEHGRGSTAVIGALGAEIRVVKTAKGRMTLETSKQKDHEESAPLKFVLTESLDSVVPLPDGWNPDDIFSDPAPAPASDIDQTAHVRDRLAAVIWHMFSAGRGATKPEAIGVIKRGDTAFGRASQSQLYTAWTTLEKDGVLVAGSTPARFKLDPNEADRLSFGPPRLPERPGGDGQ